MVVSPGDERRERLLRRVAAWTVTAVVGESDGLGEGEAEVGHPSDADGDLGHLDGVGETRAEMVVFRSDEDLALPGEAPPRPRVLHAVEVALEAETEGIGLLLQCALACTERAGGAGSEPGSEVGLPLLTTQDPPAHQGIDPLVRPAHAGGEVDHSDRTRHRARGRRRGRVGFDRSLRHDLRIRPGCAA